jgi:hypothetical protein
LKVAYFLLRKIRLTVIWLRGSRPFGCTIYFLEQPHLVLTCSISRQIPPALERQPLFGHLFSIQQWVSKKYGSHSADVAKKSPIRHPASNIQDPISSIQHQLSSTHHIKAIYAMATFRFPVRMPAHDKVVCLQDVLW